VLEVRNSNGFKCSLQDVLVFTDDPALVEAFKTQESEELNEISNNTEIGETYDFESHSPAIEFEEDWFKDRPGLDSTTATNNRSSFRESQEKNSLTRSGSQSLKIERKANNNNNTNNFGTVPGPSYSPNDNSPTKISPRSVPVSPMLATRSSSEVQLDRPDFDVLLEQVNIETQSSHRRTNSSGGAVNELPVSRKWGRK